MGRLSGLVWIPFVITFLAMPRDASIESLAVPTASEMTRFRLIWRAVDNSPIGLRPLLSLVKFAGDPS